MEVFMENNDQIQEFSLEDFNISKEFDDIEIVLDQNFEAAVESVGRRT
jgi:hypothetical protein